MNLMLHLLIFGGVDGAPPAKMPAYSVNLWPDRARRGFMIGDDHLSTFRAAAGMNANLVRLQIGREGGHVPPVHHEPGIANRQVSINGATYQPGQHTPAYYEDDHSPQAMIRDEQTESAALYSVWLHGGVHSDGMQKDSRLQRLRGEVSDCSVAGVKVVIDLHQPPGGSVDPDATYPRYRIMNKTQPNGKSNWTREAFLKTWEDIAQAFAGNPTVVGFDLVNEPAVGKSDFAAWSNLALEAAKRIRRVNRTTPIIVESAYGKPHNIAFLDPLPQSLGPVVYSVHFYEPYRITSQGVQSKYAINSLPYPQPRTLPKGGKTVSDFLVDRDTLSEALKPVRKFQADNKAKIYIGEFSCSPLAQNGDPRFFANNDSAANWVYDAAWLFEKEHWSWTYHAWREASGWDIENDGFRDGFISPGIVNGRRRQDVLGTFFRRNEVPLPSGA